MAKQSTAFRIGSIVLVCATAPSGGSCSHTVDIGGVSDGGREPDPALTPTLDGSTGLGTGMTTASDGVVVATAGDIAGAGGAQSATADLLDNLLQTRHLTAILPLGDEAYPDGSLTEFQSFYAPSWGRPELLAITHPVPGNHEYADTTAAGYFDFFDGSNSATGIAGPRGGGYYSFDVGAWHVIALNTSEDCRWVPCAAGSPQHQWLVADLAAHPTTCTLAFWHHPRFQAGTVSGEASTAAPLWDALFDAGADVVVNGHEHGYQQLAPLDKAGALDPVHGMRTFVVGTGGGDYDTTFGGPHSDALETKVVSTHGVLELTLRPTAYDWRFIPVGSTTPTGASGTAACH